jgi:hypothetical protein
MTLGATLAPGGAKVRKPRWWRSISVAVVTIVAIGGVSAPAAATGNASGVAANSLCSTAVGTSAGYAPGNKLVVSQAANGCITLNGGLNYKYRTTQFVKVEVTSEFGLADPQIIQPKSGVTFPQIDAKLAEAGQGGVSGGAAIRWFTGDKNNSGKAELFGGLGTAGSPDKPSTVSFERALSAGTYYVAQMRASGDIKPSTTAVSFVVGNDGFVAQWAFVNQRLTVVNAGTASGYADSFSAYNTVIGAVNPNEIKTNALISVGNKTGSVLSPRELHFFQWTQVQPGTTNEQVCASYSGGPSKFVVVNDSLVTQTFGTLSPGGLVNYKLTVPAGLYWVTSFIPDTDTGTPHALEHPADAPNKCEGVIVSVVSQIATSGSSSSNVAQQYDLAA